VAPDADDFADLVARVDDIVDPDEVRRVVDGLPSPVRRRLFDGWDWRARPGQAAPDGDWRVWLIMAGRGFGKTRAGAEWVWARAREVPGARIALVGGTIEEVVKVMVDGVSGLAATARTGEYARWSASRGCVEMSGGCQAFPYSAERPDKLRGPEHHFAWCDELAKFGNAQAVWDNLRLGLRLGVAPRVVATTTPRPTPLMRALDADARAGRDKVVLSGGGTRENDALPPGFAEAVTGLYAGTRFARQELDGELIADVEGSLWPRDVIEAARLSGTLAREELVRVVIGVDPPASVGGDACGIVACGKRADGTLFVLGDHSVRGMRPEGWARAVVRAAELWGADRVVAEKNQGGDMVESVLRSVEAGLPVRMVPAVLGKAARAEPVAALFERGTAKLAGAFPALEDELAGLTISGRYEGPGRSPDRADACVWALSELQWGKKGAEPRVRML
jgi:phage terminase large subunit-like protein